MTGANNLTLEDIQNFLSFLESELDDELISINFYSDQSGEIRNRDEEPIISFSDFEGLECTIDSWNVNFTSAILNNRRVYLDTVAKYELKIK